MVYEDDEICLCDKAAMKPFLTTMLESYVLSQKRKYFNIE